MWNSLIFIIQENSSPAFLYHVCGCKLSATWLCEFVEQNCWESAKINFFLQHQFIGFLLQSPDYADTFPKKSLLFMQLSTFLWLENVLLHVYCFPVLVWNDLPRLIYVAIDHKINIFKENLSETWSTTHDVNEVLKLNWTFYI